MTLTPPGNLPKQICSCSPTPAAFSPLYKPLQCLQSGGGGRGGSKNRNGLKTKTTNLIHFAARRFIKSCANTQLPIKIQQGDSYRAG